jgi:hypothetical protein
MQAIFGCSPRPETELRIVGRLWSTYDDSAVYQNKDHSTVANMTEVETVAATVVAGTVGIAAVVAVAVAATVVAVAVVVVAGAVVAVAVVAVAAYGTSRHF